MRRRGDELRQEYAADDASFEGTIAGGRKHVSGRTSGWRGDGSRVNGTVPRREDHKPHLLSWERATAIEMNSRAVLVASLSGPTPRSRICTAGHMACQWPAWRR